MTDGSTAGGRRKRVLVLTKFLPHGPRSGGLIRTEALVGALRRKFDVKVIGYDEHGINRPRGKLASAGNALATRRAYQVSRWDTPWFRREIARGMREFRPDAVFVDYLQLATLGLDLPVPRLLDMHNVESVFAAAVAETTKGPARRLAARDARMLKVLEETAAREYELVTVNSPIEAGRAPKGVEVIPNGCYPSREPLGGPVENDVACFVGLFSWLPNIEGAEWLVREVLPHLPERVRIQLVGRRPDRRVKALEGPRVEVTGEVPDTWPYVCGAGVVIAPILSTGGTRHKILEGMLAARPVIATPRAADGFEDLEGHGLILEERPEDFAKAVADLTGDPERATALGAEARATVIERYDWEKIGDRFLALCESRLGLS